MANMDKVGDNWELDLSIEASGDKVVTMPTKNKFVDANVQVTVSTPAGVLASGSTSASVTDTASILTESGTQPSSGEYVTVTAQGAVTVSTAGFLAANTSQSSTAITKYYTIQNATFSVDGASVKTTQNGYVANNTTVGTISSGAQTITGGALSSGAASSQISSDGYYNGTSYDTGDKVTLATTEASGYYKVTSSGSVTVNRAVVTKQVTTAGYFSADGTAQTAIAADSTTVSAPDNPYFIKKSTLSASSITPATFVQTVTIGEGYYPSDRTVTVSAMGAGSATAGVATTGLATYFDTGSSSSNDVSITPNYTVTASGYFDASVDPVSGTTSYYSIKTTSVTQGTTTISGSTVTRGTATWSTGWITSGSISAAAFTNEPVSPKTKSSYLDISATSAAPVLVSQDGLYINAGYTDDLFISLARLVPDGSDVKGHGDYILAGHSAYDNDGILVAGTITTYDGSYTIS